MTDLVAEDGPAPSFPPAAASLTSSRGTVCNGNDPAIFALLFEEKKKKRSRRTKKEVERQQQGQLMSPSISNSCSIGRNGSGSDDASQQEVRETGDRSGIA